MARRPRASCCPHYLTARRASKWKANSGNEAIYFEFAEMRLSANAGNKAGKQVIPLTSKEPLL